MDGEKDLLTGLADGLYAVVERTSEFSAMNVGDQVELDDGMYEVAERVFNASKVRFFLVPLKV